jgi:L-fuconolactonase
LEANDEWLGKRSEPSLEPDLPIIDSHHHFYEAGPGRPHAYLPDDFVRDAASHKFVATVFVDCLSKYRESGPEHLRFAGETAFIDSLVSAYARAHPQAPKFCAGIVTRADLLDARLDELIEAHRAASPQRFRGVRHFTAWDKEAVLQYDFPQLKVPEGVMREPAFARGFAQLAKLGVVFDAWLYSPQLPELIALARKHPETTVVLEHVGGVLLGGPYAQRREEIEAPWRRAIQELARCDNVHVKLGGLLMRRQNLYYGDRPVPPSSDELAAAFEPYFHHAIDCFSPARCMFESNMPADRDSSSPNVLWNSYKKLSRRYSAAERADLFAGTAARVYRLEGGA